MTTRDDDLTVSRPALLTERGDHEFREMLHNLLAFSTRLERIRRSFGQKIGVTGQQYTVLISIRQLQGETGVGIRALSDHLSLSGAFLTRETNKLAEAGLITKSPHPEDRRRVKLRVTEEARRRLRELAPVQREINDVLFDPVPPESFSELRGLAHALRESSEHALRLSDYLVPPRDVEA